MPRIRYSLPPPTRDPRMPKVQGTARALQLSAVLDHETGVVTFSVASGEVAHEAPTVGHALQWLADQKRKATVR